MSLNQIPVLYLFENVFYPETIIPMLLSDKQSQTLAIDAFNNDKLIALFSTHPKSKGIATVGKIILLDDKKEDGKITAIIQGLHRVQLTTLVQQVPYPIYEFNQYHDQNEPHILKEGSIERLFSIFENYLNRHVKNNREREIFMREINTPRKLIFNISLFMIKDIELKIIFLESKSLSDRINILDALLNGETPESENREIAEAIKNFENLEHPEYFKNVAN
jgi:ATP-dependent Lon protease